MSKSANDLKVVELKEKLRSLGLSYTGNKAELILRLNASDPSGTWREKVPVNENTTTAGAMSSENIPVMEAELVSLRQEVERLKVQLQVPTHAASTSAEVDLRPAQPKINIGAIAELLATFDGTTGNYETWERQLKLLKRAYKLDDEHTKILVGMRLKGRAAEWLHSRPELIEVSVEALLCELKTMYNHRPNKMLLRKKFEERVWKKGEPFSEYMHQKIILGNLVPVDEEEVVEYIIDGIPDRILRDQARVGGLRTRTALLEAFERITLWDRKHAGTTGEEKTQHRQKGSGDGRNGQKKTPVSEKKNCYNCGLPDHFSKDCPTKENGPKCFKCGKRGHIAAKCTEEHAEKKESCVATQVTATKCSKEVVINGREIVALIDTGSDLCLMRGDEYAKIGSPALERKETRFRGVGSHENMAYGEFRTEVAIDGHTYPILIRVVSDCAITRNFIIGTDFLNTTDLRMRGGSVSISPMKKTVADTRELPEIFQVDLREELSEIDLSHVKNSEHRSTLRNIIDNYRPLKTKETDVKMKIVLKDEEPVYQRARRLSPSEKEEVNKHISEWIQNGIVRPSLSDYASPVVLTKKKDGSTRLCVDYRQLNKKIIRDRYPLPLIEDQLDLLQTAKYFSTIDLKNGFFHVSVEKESQKYTAFIVPDGHYEFLKVPFGLCNSPSIFQRFINATFKDAIRNKVVLTYLDDLIIPSENEDAGIERLEIVLKIASEAGLIVNWKKCCFLQKKVEFLGHVIEDGRVYPSARKVEAVRKFPEPINVKQVQSFLGLSGYFRKFVPKYSIIARPLSDLLKSNAKFCFRENEKEAFVRLKDILCNQPVLRLFQVNATTELHTDASIEGYGAILLQKDGEDGAFHPIFYWSGKTTPAERRYTSYELEVLAIVKALVKFRVYLLGISFKIVTDCRAFTLTMRKRDLCVRVARWALLLEEYNYSIEHRPGKSMIHVDALSRNPLPVCMSIDECNSTTAKFRQAQQNDSDVKKLIETVSKESMDDYVIQNDLLFKRRDADLLLVVPKAMSTQVIKQAHEQGHFSVAKTEAILLRDYWMPNMKGKIEKVIKNCVACILAERKYGKQEGYLNTIEKGDLPLDTYHIDHLGPLPSTRKNYKHIFVVIDAFTKFSWLYATKTTNAAEVIAKLKKQSTIFGNPRRIISDRGTAFTSKEFEDYCAEEKIRHVLTTTGVPRANGQVERVNRVLIPLLTKLSDPKREEWFKFLDLAQLHLNCAPHRSIGTTPFRLLFGAHAHTRDDPQIRELLETEWIDNFQSNRADLRSQAKECIAKIQQENRSTYNKKRKAATRYSEDDWVAIKRTQLGPGLKLANKYLGPYMVIQVL